MGVRQILAVRLALLALALPPLCFGQDGAQAVPPACAGFLGYWSGSWSQGFYGTQRIHVTHVSDQCVATLGYSPTEAMPQVSHQMPIKDGVIAFACNVPGGACRMEVQGAELKFTYKEPSGFVNIGTFRRDR